MHARPIVSTDEAYEETIRFLYSLERFGILLGLENISTLLKELGNPQLSFPVIHVAGSNGKGSTSAFIYGILRSAGLKTALYTSPHLNDFRERIRINGALVSRDAVISSARKIRELYDPDRTTYFEFTTAMAFDCIAQERPDAAVVEVGLGGRLDATNTTRPTVTVITDISREHEDYLGIGIASVAREKAGIIKRGTPLVTGASRRDARQVILEVAKRLGAPVAEFGRDFKGLRTGRDRFTYTSRRLQIENITPPAPCTYQMKNGSLAIAAVEELIGQGWRVDEQCIRKGIEETRFPGRFETVRRDPDVLIDGAHTPEGMRLLKRAVASVYPGVKPLLLLGVLQDKNYEVLARIIAPVAREVVCVPPLGNRALDPNVLASLVRQCGVPARPAGTIGEGLEMLLKRASKSDLILAAGSLYMIGVVRSACGLDDQ
ncbi:MAG: folylpolyglutamate synthase/dihydrofolate synthase family protein [Thermodesulfobacteriota bacterium]